MREIMDKVFGIRRSCRRLELRELVEFDKYSVWTYEKAVTYAS